MIPRFYLPAFNYTTLKERCPNVARQATLRARHTLPVHFEAQPERHKRQAVFHRAAIRKGEQKSRKIHGVARNSLHKHFGQMKSNARKRETHRGKNRRRNRGLPQIDRNAPEPAEVAQCRAAAGGRLPDLSAPLKIFWPSTYQTFLSPDSSAFS